MPALAILMQSALTSSLGVAHREETRSDNQGSTFTRNKKGRLHL